MFETQAVRKVKTFSILLGKVLILTWQTSRFDRSRLGRQCN